MTTTHTYTHTDIVIENMRGCEPIVYSVDYSVDNPPEKSIESVPRYVAECFDPDARMHIVRHASMKDFSEYMHEMQCTVHKCRVVGI